MEAGGAGGGGSVRRPSTSKHRGAAEDLQNPFTGTGLLASREFRGPAGHGVKTGRDAVAKNGDISPLMDMGPKSMFVSGSLLEKREREMGPGRPVIDRNERGSESDE